MDRRTVPSLLETRALGSPNAVAHWTLDDGCRWIPPTWREFFAAASRLSAALRHICLTEGQHVGIMAPTSQAWEYLQMAVLMAGGVVVGLDPHDRPDNVNEIARRAELTGLVVGSRKSLMRLGERERRDLRFVIFLTDAIDASEAKNGILFGSLLAFAGQVATPFWREATGREAATIVFTSGTTGAPKGILYTHEQVIFACESIVKAFGDTGEGSNLVCWLPLSNLFQRMINLCAQ